MPRARHLAVEGARHGGTAVQVDRTLYELVKRGADIAAAAAVLMASAPFWVWAFLAITLTDGLPFLYSQTRVGRNGRIFRILKFRSMVRDAEQRGVPVYSQRDDPRVTRVGRVMRKTAIDEIPQLLSILKGDMSWVGPRPARPEEVVTYLRDIPGYGLRHQVRPGLTGFAQVCATDYGDIAEKLALDLHYIRHRSLSLDLTLYVQSWVNTLSGGWDRARGAATGRPRA
jgi:lipopolysaccharide/colanic/teichoic acid biosynthesis glycosyltransferase